MNSLTDSGDIKELYCGTSGFSYILHDNNCFTPTKYKVLLSQEQSSFVKCMKMQYNGHVQFYYMTNGLKPLSSLLSSLDGDRLMTIAANLIGDILEVKHNGFLSCCNIDPAYDHIYVDTSTYKVKLVYLPASVQFFSDSSGFESEIRSGLVRTITMMVNLQSSKTMGLMQYLSNGLYSMEDLYCYIKGKAPIKNQAAAQNGPQTGSGRLRLTALNAPGHVVLEVNKDSFIIGKNPKSADGVVSYSKMVSRTHCRIDKNGSQYTLTDLNSSNGSFINHVRLQPQSPFPVHNGDIIRLANCDFQVSLV